MSFVFPYVLQSVIDLKELEILMDIALNLQMNLWGTDILASMSLLIHENGISLLYLSLL